MPDALTILTSAGISGLITVALVWFAQSWISERLKNSIKHEYDQKLAAYQAQLKAEHDAGVEKLRSDLQVAASERQVRYQKLHEQVAETLAQTYALLRKVHEAVKTYVDRALPEPSEEERSKRLKESVEAFRAYYQPRRIYLSPELAKKVDATDAKLQGSANRHAATQRLQNQLPVDTLLEREDRLDEMMGKELPALFEHLEHEFRKLLGFAG